MRCGSPECASRIENAGVYGHCLGCNRSFCTEHTHRHAEACSARNDVSFVTLTGKSCGWSSTGRDICGTALKGHPTKVCIPHNVVYCLRHAKLHAGTFHQARNGLSRVWMDDHSACVADTCISAESCAVSFADPTIMVLLCGECCEFSCPDHAWDKSHTCDKGALHGLLAFDLHEPDFVCSFEGGPHVAICTSMGCLVDRTAYCIGHMDDHLRGCAACKGFQGKLPAYLVGND